MQFSAALLAVAAASVADAYALFHASEFTAACQPHSTLCSYSFGITQPGAGETIAVQCKAQVQGNDGTLPEVTDGTCEQSSRTWTVTKAADGGRVLTVSQQVTPSSSQSATYTIPAGDLVVEQTTGSKQQKYTGAKEFDLEG